MNMKTVINGKQEELKLFSSEDWYAEGKQPCRTDIWIHPEYPDLGYFEIDYAHFISGWDDVDGLTYHSTSYDGKTLEEDIDIEGEEMLEEMIDAGVYDD